MLNRRGKPDAEKPSSGRGPQRFGHEVDPVEAGRRGGLASGVARQPAEKRRRELEAKILESRNGAAQLRLLQLSLEQRYQDLDEREFKVAERERKARQADAQLCRLLDEIDQAKLELAEVNQEWETRNAEPLELERTIATLVDQHGLELDDEAADA